jgi:hypothetical protein
MDIHNALQKEAYNILKKMKIEYAEYLDTEHPEIHDEHGNEIQIAIENILNDNNNDNDANNNGDDGNEIQIAIENYVNDINDNNDGNNNGENNNDNNINNNKNFKKRKRFRTRQHLDFGLPAVDSEAQTSSDSRRLRGSSLENRHNRSAAIQQPVVAVEINPERHIDASSSSSQAFGSPSSLQINPSIAPIAPIIAVISPSQPSALTVIQRECAINTYNQENSIEYQALLDTNFHYLMRHIVNKDECDITLVRHRTAVFCTNLLQILKRKLGYSRKRNSIKILKSSN